MKILPDVLTAFVVALALLSFPGCNSGGSTPTAPDGEHPSKVAAKAGELVRVFPFNDLGMHCVDKEFSVFSILPPTMWSTPRRCTGILRAIRSSSMTR